MQGATSDATHELTIDEDGDVGYSADKAGVVTLTSTVVLPGGVSVEVSVQVDAGGEDVEVSLGVDPKTGSPSVQATTSSGEEVEARVDVGFQSPDGEVDLVVVIDDASSGEVTVDVSEGSSAEEANVARDTDGDGEPDEVEQVQTCQDRTECAPLGTGDTDIVPDDVDNCPNVANPDQADLDCDGVGDACDPDKDGDAIPANLDCDDLNARDTMTCTAGIKPPIQRKTR